MSSEVAAGGAGPLPDFLIIGAPRSGTTSLYHYLDSHPKIFMSPIKEPGYFALKDGPAHYDGPGDMEMHSMGGWMVRHNPGYTQLFAGAAPGQLKGEASTNYLYHPAAPAAIKESIPAVQMFAVLRNPVDRAYSHFLLHRQLHREPARDFARALVLEKSRLAANWIPDWSYMGAGRYAEHLQRYYAHFDRSQLRIFLFEDLERDTPGVVQQILETLGVDATFVPPNIEQRFNAANVPRSAVLETFLRRRNPARAALRAVIPTGIAKAAWRLVDGSNHARIELDPYLRRRLLEECRPQIEELATLIDRDLSHWLD